MNEQNKKIIFQDEVNLRIDDINYGNHLCHTKFVNLIHNARALFLKQHNLSELNCYGVSLIILNLTIDYKWQCYFNDTLDIKMLVNEINNKATFRFDYIVTNKNANKIAAIAQTKLGCIDLNKNSLTRPPIELKNFLNNITLE